jgi:hypothetical protein
LGGEEKVDQALNFLRDRRPLGDTMEADELLLQVEGLFLVEHFREGIYRDIPLKWIDMAILIHFNGEHGDSTGFLALFSDKPM